MRNELVNFVGGCLDAVGIAALFRQIASRRRITIINYHDPDPKSFEAHLQYWQRHYSLIGLDAVQQALEGHDFSNLPDYPLLITFDDGHVGNYHLLPLLREYRVPAAIYVTAGLSGTRRHFWWLELRRRGLDAEVESLKKLPSAEFRHRLKELCGYEFEREYEDRHALNEKELREFHTAGITIGAHSVNHPLLDCCTDEEIAFECRESKYILENILNGEVRHFALPNGNYNAIVLNAVVAAGFQTNRTTVPGWNGPLTSPLELKNYGIYDAASTSRAKLQASGFMTWFKH